MKVRLHVHPDGRVAVTRPNPLARRAVFQLGVYVKKEKPADPEILDAPEELELTLVPNTQETLPYSEGIQRGLVFIGWAETEEEWFARCVVPNPLEHLPFRDIDETELPEQTVETRDHWKGDPENPGAGVTVDPAMAKVYQDERKKLIDKDKALRKSRPKGTAVVPHWNKK